MPSFTLTGRQTFDCDAGTLHRYVADPHQQAQWNTLYERVEAPEPFLVTADALFRGVFKGFGAVDVHFEDVTVLAFTHVAPLRILGLHLGVFRHTYAVSVESAEPLSTLTQTVRVSTTGLGRLVTGVFKRAFSDRMPESFKELRTYIARQNVSGAAA